MFKLMGKKKSQFYAKKICLAGPMGFTGMRYQVVGICWPGRPKTTVMSVRNIWRLGMRPAIHPASYRAYPAISHWE